MAWFPHFGMIDHCCTLRFWPWTNTDLRGFTPYVMHICRGSIIGHDVPAQSSPFGKHDHIKLHYQAAIYILRPDSDSKICHSLLSKWDQSQGAELQREGLAPLRTCRETQYTQQCEKSNPRHLGADFPVVDLLFAVIVTLGLDGVTFQNSSVMSF